MIMQVKGFPTILFTSPLVRSPIIQRLGHSLVACHLHSSHNVLMRRPRVNTAHVVDDHS